MVSHIIKNLYNPRQRMSSTNRTTKKKTRIFNVTTNRNYNKPPKSIQKISNTPREKLKRCMYFVGYPTTNRDKSKNRNRHRNSYRYTDNIYKWLHAAVQKQKLYLTPKMIKKVSNNTIKKLIRWMVFGDPITNKNRSSTCNNKKQEHIINPRALYSLWRKNNLFVWQHKWITDE